GKGRWQLEAGLAWERDGVAGQRRRTRSTPILLRTGLDDVLELRFATDGWMHEKRDAEGQVLRSTGVAGLGLGLKWHVQDGDEQEGRAGRAWLLELDLPSGSADFKEQGLRPSLRHVAEWDLPAHLSLGLMAGVQGEHRESGARCWTGLLAVSVSRPLGERLQGFAELAAPRLARSRDGGRVISADVGLSWLLSPDLQLDVAVGKGLSRQATDVAWTAGLSMRR
ncbi:MAG TPA: transporter, partial [Burkholderiaceae bacterium]|nr:transporter [Burkholderiaceae bacterium]